MPEVYSTLVDGGYQLNIGHRRISGLLRKRAHFEKIDNWDRGIKGVSPVTAAIIEELDQSGLLSRLDSSGVFISFDTAANLANLDAQTLNLLPPFPFQLDIQSRGSLGTKNFEVQYFVSQGGVRIIGTCSTGIFEVQDQKYRIGNPLFSILKNIDHLNSQNTIEGKIEAFASLRLLLPDEVRNDANISSEKLLLRIRIAHVTAFSLRPSMEGGNVSFDPIPMHRVDLGNGESEAELAVTPAATDKFAEEFRTQKAVNSTYALETGYYVYIDPSVRTALRVVKQKQRAPLEERIAFLLSPTRMLNEALRGKDDDDDGSIAETIFFETSEYSERITGLGEWIPPQLSYLEKNQNNWLPERFSIVLAAKLVTGKPEDLPTWINQVKTALAENRDQVKLGEVSVPTNTPGLLATLQRLQPPEATPPKSGGLATTEKEEAGQRIKVFQTKNNFDHSEYKRHFRRRKLDNSETPTMKVQLKTHQIDGVSWMIDCYQAGWPGILLADDMGLGKTLQSLTFLMLLRRENILKSGRPALVVAPTSLLRNWQDEHSKHTLDIGLGPPLVAFGTELRNLKLGKATVDGVVLLDSAKLIPSNWILTTYETIRDYHISFACVPFSIAILDEIQKAKNPVTRINATLKTLNADFIISMTGTPVENSISDLWSITDITAPGYLPPLREFMKAYGKTQEPSSRQKSLEKLSTELLQAGRVDEQVIPPYALRRLKEDVAKDLPPKHQSPMLRADMRGVQAQRYADVSAAAQTGAIKILRALHDFRSISLHPADPETVSGGLMDGSDYINMSARLKLTFEKLEQVAARKEKALVFVNNRRMQTVLSRLIENRFGCSKPEYIRGDTIAGQRQEIVNRFSALNGFAVLVLSPRAAGVGLNIVAANHVIHLDRWWNPAVEDQCTDRAYRIGATKEVYVYTVGAIHPALKNSSYDVILDNLLKSRREVSRQIFSSQEISAADFVDALDKAGLKPDYDEFLREIDHSGYLGLEEFVRDQIISEGLNANLTRRTGDGGADLVIKDDLGEIVALVQCKFTANIENAIDAGLVQDARRVRERWAAPEAIVIGVTNARSFAPRVKHEFKTINGVLVARDQLAKFRFLEIYRGSSHPFASTAEA